MAKLARRSLLAGAAALPSLAFANGSGAVASALAASPDADLIQALADWKRGTKMLDACTELPDEHPDVVAAWVVVNDANDRLENTPARSPAGLAAKLWRLLPGVAECRESEVAVVYGQPMPDEVVADWTHRLIWNLIHDAEAMGAANV